MARRAPRRSRALALVAAAGGVLFLAQEGPSFGFCGAAGPWARSAQLDGSRQGLVRRAASDEGKASNKGFGDDEQSKALAKASDKERRLAKAREDKEKGWPVDEAAIMKDEEEEKTKALSTSRLNDLRGKTLARRQKREGEIDEYEMGKAVIAKYGRKAAVMPPKVAQRAAKRGFVIGGAFYGAMLAVFTVAVYVYKSNEIIIPPSLLGFITLSLLFLAIGGGSFGLMSASWNPDKEGSVLGLKEFSQNLGYIGDSFRKAALSPEFDKAIEQRRERKALLEAKEDRKKEITGGKKKKNKETQALLNE